MTRITKDSIPLSDLAHWGEVAGPKGTNQWVPGRSAMEAARFWLNAGNEFPPDLARSLGRHPDFGIVHNWSAEPEVRLKFDGLKGEPRNTDLLVLAEDEVGSILMAVEAKADEPFGATIADQLAAVLDARLANPRSKALDRVESLAKTVLPHRAKGTPALARIRYQLLTAVVGAIAEAHRRRINRCIVLIQEFRTNLTNDDLHARNHGDLEAFLSRLSGGVVRHVIPGEIAGPFETPAAAMFTPAPRLYLAKTTYDLRTGASSQL